ncbi:hypothetical protein NDU88_004680 [Pleurodeles waltl]|uniref:Uncharacterized protein n=1 Tax=Pleurodeles waltl TaxID=8319 RepID=A0AAV7TSK8_PLEWA|nr:hypothetical protein NDU88_004680 [Pleurodeles waltl]
MGVSKIEHSSTPGSVAIHLSLKQQLRKEASRRTRRNPFQYGRRDFAVMTEVFLVLFLSLCGPAAAVRTQTELPMMAET